MSRGDITWPTMVAIQVALTALSIVAPVPVAAAVVGYTEAEGDLIRFDLLDGDVEVVGSTGLEPEAELRALAEGPDGQFYGVVGEIGVATDRLVRIDPSTGSMTGLGDLGLSGAFGVAFDVDGNLWLTADHLYTVDLATGIPNLEHLLPETMAGLVIAGGTLYAFPGTFDNVRLVKINLSDGAVIPVAELPFEGPVEDADFDDQGRLWIRVLDIEPGGLFGTGASYYRIENVENPDPVVAHSEFFPYPHDGPLRDAPSLVVRGSQDAVEVPTLGGLGLGILAMTLLAAGTGLLRRRRG